MEKIKIDTNDRSFTIESIRPQSVNIIEIIFSGEVPEDYGDGQISIFNEGGILCSILTGYRTIYRDQGRTVYLSCDGSIYQDTEVTGGLPEDPYTPTPDELLNNLRISKLSEISTACNQTILSGCDVLLSDGTISHYSLAETDQINLTAAVSMVQQGMPEYPYHADGELCRLYPAADILAIGEVATAYKFYHTTYCNHLNVWIRRAESLEELEGIYYGAELPDDLKENMGVIMVAVSGREDEAET